MTEGTIGPGAERSEGAIGPRAGRLVIMGSGETAPTMVEVHRSVLRAAGEGPALLLSLIHISEPTRPY